MIKPQPTFEEFLARKAEAALTRSKAGEETRCSVSVALSRRNRGDSVSDRFGKFSANGTLRWLDDKLSDRAAAALNALHFLPVIEPAVSANLAAMVTARVKPTVEAATKRPEAAGVVGVAEGVLAYLDGHEDHWSEGLEARVALLAQLSYGYFVRSRHDPRKKGETVKETVWGEEVLPQPGEYRCAACAAGGPFLGEVAEDGTCRCPECGQPAEVVEPPGEGPAPVPVGEREKNTGDSEASVHDSFEFRVDERRSKGGNLRAARWFERHYLMSRDEIEQENPGFDPGTPEEWSFTLKWQHALESGTDQHLEQFDPECDIFEVREICLLPEEYATYRVPEGGGFVLKTDDGQPVLGEEGSPVFEIREGERLLDKFPAGFRFRRCGQKIMPGTPEDAGIKAYDFREEWTYGGFRPDPHSFWHRPLTALLSLQDDITTLYTIDFEHRQRASKTNLVFDDHMFEVGDFDYDEVPTKMPVEPGDDIRRHYDVIQAPQMRTAMEGLQVLFGLLPQVGAPPPAASGAPDPTEDTYRGQLLKRQAALGLLAPSQQSKAQAKVCWFKQQLKVAQREWPDERFAYLRARFGEEWREEDVQAFRDADLDRDVIVSYQEGTEVPSTLLEREQKLGAFLVTLMDAIPAFKDLPPDIASDLRVLVSQYADVSGIDFDIGDSEADRRLAQRRYDRIKEGLARCATEDDVFVMMAHPQLQPFPRETHAAHVEFWSDRARALLAQHEPDFFLVAQCDEMIRRHDAAGVADNQTALTNQIESEAPAQALMAEEQAAAQAAEGDKLAAEAEAKEQERAAAGEEKERDRAHQVGMQAMSLASQERQKAQPGANA